MKRTISRWMLIPMTAMLLVLPPTLGQDDERGQVKLPLERYTELIEAARVPVKPPRPAPTGFALGNARVTVEVGGVEPLASGTIRVLLSIEVLENDWVSIPVLPPGTPVDAVQVGGKPVQLVPTEDGLSWSTNRAGAYTMQLTYKIDAARSEQGFTLPVPVPPAAAIQLDATLPGTGIDASVIPSAGVSVAPVGANTRVTATVPTTQGVQINWRTPGKLVPTMSRAVYRGRVVGDSVRWVGEIDVELFSDETTKLKLLPTGVTLDSLEVDGEPSTILVENGQFATLVGGRGQHRIVVGLQVPIHRDTGPPRVDLRIPPTPVSRLELTLPGKVELSVEPAANVTTNVAEGATTATVHVPMTSHVAMTWSEAIPEALQAELRVNAATYHAVHADEGVLYVRALLDYEVSRGETNRIELLLPAAAQVEEIVSDPPAVSDWRVGKSDERGDRPVTVFLDRQLRGALTLDVRYDRSLADVALDAIAVPLVQPVAAQRRRGMVALLAGRELTLDPVEERGATRVGENQLPHFVREQLEMTVAHTFKYAEKLPELVVAAAVPERVEGKFDAVVDTLASLGDVTLAGSSSVAVNVKSGSIQALSMRLPADVNLLSLSAPSLRTYKVDPRPDWQTIDVEFTQEMEGQFRIELTYERIMATDDPDVRVPTLTVVGAEVEQGRIAVEALSAVEVRPVGAEQLTTLDVNELPRQLVLRTTNPILHAYKYVHATPPPSLVLQVTRHDLVAVQEAAIDHADYRTLFTEDGLVVTTVQFTVRNSRKQFLRVELPEGSEVWSAFVDGRAEKPALATAEGKAVAVPVLIKIINSADPFAVELVYAAPGSRIGHMGSVEGALPRPDILVTESRWDVYLPDGFQYAEPRSNMELVQGANRVTRETMTGEFAERAGAAITAAPVEPLRITVPASGVRYSFEKLYANQTDREAWFRVPYVSARGRAIGHMLSLIGIGLLALSIALRLRSPEPRRAARVLVAIGLAGIAAVVVALRVYHVGLAFPLTAAVVAAIALSLVFARRHLGAWRTSDVAGGV